MRADALDFIGGAADDRGYLSVFEDVGVDWLGLDLALDARKKGGDFLDLLFLG